MNQELMLRICSALLVLAGPALAGDVLELRDGSILDGKYQGGTATSIRFETAAGLQVIPRDSALALTFAAPAPAVAPALAPAPAPPATPAVSARVLVPAGSLLLVRFDGPVSSNDKVGQRFSGKLQADLVVNGQPGVKAGTTVYGRVDEAKKAGRLVGKSSVAFSLKELLVGGAAVPIVTTNYAEASQSSFHNTARNVAVGALVGEAFDSSGGAKKGAAVGLGMSAIRKGDSVTYPAGALVEFRLTQAVEIGAGR